MNLLPLLALGLVVTGCSRGPSTDVGPNVADTAAATGAEAGTGPGENTIVPADETSDAAANEAAASIAPATQAYLGRWTGVEGMYLVVTAKPAGGVAMTMQWDLDHKGNFDGTATANGLRFVRNGVAETARHTDGDATGLKYLAGKKDCLTVKPGEGYCRG